MLAQVCSCDPAYDDNCYCEHYADVLYCYPLAVNDECAFYTTSTVLGPSYDKRVSAGVHVSPCVHVCVVCAVSV